MYGFVFSGGSQGDAGATTTTFDLASGSGLTLLDSASGLASASFGSTGLVMTTNTVSTALFGNPYAAPIYQTKIARQGFTGVEAIARLHVNSAGGSNPEVFLSIALDSDTLSTNQSHVGIRSGFGSAIKYNGSTYGAGPSITAQQRSDGLWVKINAGGTGGHAFYYSLQNTSDVSSISWTTWPNAPWDVTGWPVGSNNQPGTTIRVGVGVSDQATGATQLTGRISHFSVTTIGSLS